MFRVLYKGVPVECDTVEEAIQLISHLEEETPLALPPAPTPRPPVTGEDVGEEKEEPNLEAEVGDARPLESKTRRPRMMVLDRFKTLLTLIQDRALNEPLNIGVIAGHLDIPVAAVTITIRQMHVYLKGRLEIDKPEKRVMVRQWNREGAAYIGKEGGVIEALLKIQGEREKTLDKPGALMVYRRAGGKL